MIKVVDIECLKNKYFHRVGTQFDNAISVAEKEFLIDAYTKADMVAVLEELISEANKLEDPKYILETSELPLDIDGTTLPLETYALQCYCCGSEGVIDIIEKKINELKENIDGSN